jgi:biotin operon repressor
VVEEELWKVEHDIEEEDEELQEAGHDIEEFQRTFRRLGMMERG